MTTETLVAKTMWALGQSRDAAEIQRLFYSQVNHDRIPNGVAKTKSASLGLVGHVVPLGTCKKRSFQHPPLPGTLKPLAVNCLSTRKTRSARLLFLILLNFVDSPKHYASYLWPRLPSNY